MRSQAFFCTEMKFWQSWELTNNNSAHPQGIFEAQKFGKTLKTSWICIYSFCSIELTKTRNTRSLTAVCHDLSYFQKGGNALFRRTASGNVEKCNKVLRKCVQELLWTNAFHQNIFEWRNVSRAVLFWFRHWCSINHLKVVFSIICLLWLCLKSRPRARKEHEFDA